MKPERFKIDEILTRLCLFVADKFKLSTQEALAAVSRSRIANEISSKGLPAQYSYDELRQRLENELTRPQ